MNLIGHVIKPLKSERLLRRFDHASTRFILRWTFIFLFINDIYTWKKVNCSELQTHHGLYVSSYGTIKPLACAVITVTSTKWPLNLIKSEQNRMLFYKFILGSIFADVNIIKWIHVNNLIISSSCHLRYVIYTS